MVSIANAVRVKLFSLVWLVSHAVAVAPLLIAAACGTDEGLKGAFYVRCNPYIT